MAKSLEDEICELKEKNLALQRQNSALVQKVQFWKMTAAQREEEKVDLMKEINQLRLSMSRYRSSSVTLDSVLDSAMQEFGERTLTRLVDVSSDITRTIEVMKTYIRKKQEVESTTVNERQSVLDSPRDRGSNKVLRVVPMVRGRSIVKPVILLRQIDASAYVRNNNNANTNQEGEEEVEEEEEEEEEQAPAQHVLQDVYIPLRRIDAETVNVWRRERLQEDGDNADISLQSNENGAEESDTSEADEVVVAEEAVEGESEGEEDYNAMRGMDTLPEEPEEGNWSPQVILNREPVTRRNTENPLEGPSWLLDRIYRDTTGPASPAAISSQHSQLVSGSALEPDSTTDARQLATAASSHLAAALPAATSSPNVPSQQAVSESPAVAHTPTRRVKRKHSRVSSPRVSLALLDEVWPQPHASTRGNSRNDKDPTKVLVMVAKMRPDDLSVRRRSSAGPHVESTPQRQRVPLEAPSPNGSTLDAGPIVMDNADEAGTLHHRAEVERFVRENSERAVYGRSERECSNLDRPHLGYVTGRTRERSIRSERGGSVHERLERERSHERSEREQSEREKEIRRRESARQSFEREVSTQDRPEREQSSEERSAREGSVSERGRKRSARNRSRQKRSVYERSDSEGSAQDRREREGSMRERQDTGGPVRERQDTGGPVRERQDTGGLVRERQDMERSVRERQDTGGPVREGQDTEGPVRERRDREGSVQEREGTVLERRGVGSIQEIPLLDEPIQERRERVESMRDRQNMEGSVYERSSGRERMRRSSEESDADTQDIHGRTKRPRKTPTSYKEKPLNRKLRR